MANHKSAIKKNRRDIKLRTINRMNISKMRNKIKLLRKKVGNSEAEGVPTLYRETIAVIDKTVSKGTIHKNTGSRYKSRISNLMRKSGIEM